MRHPNSLASKKDDHVAFIAIAGGVLLSFLFVVMCCLCCEKYHERKCLKLSENLHIRLVKIRMIMMTLLMDHRSTCRIRTVTMCEQFCVHVNICMQ